MPKLAPSRRLNGAAHSRRMRRGGFTIVEALIALVVLMIFLLTSTVALNLFDTRAAQNRNTEAARAVVDDYINFLLDDATNSPAATAPGADLTGDGTPDGVPCTVIDTRVVPNSIPLIETRTTTPAAVVSGVLYWRVQGVGTSFGLAADSDLMQVNFTLAYVYRGQTYYYQAMTYKAKT